MHRFPALLALAPLCLAGCAPQPPATIADILPTAEVPAAAETTPVATANADAADDPAIYASADGASFDFAGHSTKGIILGTDKKAGLYAFGLDGAVLQFVPDGLLNNVDLRPTANGFIAGASDRGRIGVALYRFNGSGELAPAGLLKTDIVEPYGFCMGMRAGHMIAVLVGKDGQVRQYALSDDGTTVTGTEEKRFAIGTQSEGCVVDDVAGQLYVGEEDVGIWRYSLDPADPARLQVAPVGDGRLVADVEGMSIIADANGRHLVVSSQGDNAFAVFDIGDGAPAYAGRFRVVASGDVDGVSTTDGVDARGGPIGAYPDGLLVMQDGENTGAAQNFKLVDWRAVKAALAK